MRRLRHLLPKLTPDRRRPHRRWSPVQHALRDYSAG